ncbi:MAG: hypothetical protein QXV17_11625 [Candidatus Micrarchaeaceae archaeon]
MKMEMEKKEIVNSGNSVILDLEDKDIIEYEVFVDVIVVDWYGNLEYGKFHFFVDAYQFKEIQENPLRDYASFGVQDVIYVYLQYIPVFWKDGMEIVNWNKFGFIYKVGDNYEKYEKQISKEISIFEEMEYENIAYHE